MVGDLLYRYIWLTDLIYRSKSITFREINEKWKMSCFGEGKEMPLRTFHNYRDAIEKLFDIVIKCNLHDGYTYYIENSELVENNHLRQWLLNSFTVNNAINESRKLKDRILLENIPSGREYLMPLIEAMRDGHRVRLTYRSYWKAADSVFEVEPFCVKLFRQRWYVLCYCPYYEGMRIYGLDRIVSLKIEEDTFLIPADFDAQSFFSNLFGVFISEDAKPEHVQLKVSIDQCPFFRALPLHPSQREISACGDYSVFDYYLVPSYDFRQELLSHGADVEVISPVALRQEMKEITSSMFGNYRK